MKKRILSLMLAAAVCLNATAMPVLALDTAQEPLAAVETTDAPAGETPAPTAEPVAEVSPAPTEEPTPEPTLTPAPTETPEPSATPEPTAEPTPEPTAEPTATPTATPEPDADAPALQAQDAAQPAVQASNVVEVTVGDDTKYYTTLDEVTEALRTQTSATIKLLNDVSGTLTLGDDDARTGGDAAYILDLNGHTLSGGLTVNRTSDLYHLDLTVKDSGSNGTIQVPSGDVDDVQGLYIDTSCKLTVLGGTIDGNVTCSTGFLEVESGTFQSGTVLVVADGDADIRGGNFDSFLAKGSSDGVSISGGNFRQIENQKSTGYEDTLDKLLAAGYCFFDVNGKKVDVSSFSFLTNAHVAKDDAAVNIASVTNGEDVTNYTDLNQALTDAQKVNGSVLTLLDDVTVKEQIYVYESNFTLDLNGYTLSSGDYNTVVVRSTATLTVRDNSANSTGKIINTNPDSESSSALVSDGNVTIEGGTFSLLRWDSGTMQLRAARSTL